MTSLSIALPDEIGRLSAYALKATPVAAPAGPHRFNRAAYAAVHVVADPLAAQEPALGPAIDWEATLAFRRHILDLGLGVADAMDTAQRGMGLDWPAARALIERSLAAAALAEGDLSTYRGLLAPTVPLSRLIFQAPTRHYKTGVVFLAYLNGFQDHFVMIGGAQAMRPLPYFTALFRLADGAGLLRDPERAVARMRHFLRVYGIDG